MAQIYFSKFNINSEIYDVYNCVDLKEKILNDVFDKMDENKKYIENTTDEEGKEIIYKFCDLKKYRSKKSICGRLVKIFEGEIQRYDPSKDTVTTNNTDNCAASSTFYFDFLNEEIAFITRNTLGYKQFNYYFKMLIEQYFTNYSFELFLENNVGELKEKLHALKRIISIETTIIPPNASHKDFEAIFGPTKEEVRRSGATKVIYKMEVTPKSGRSLNIQTPFFDRIYLALKKGYASLKAKGKDENNENSIVTSEEDAPYKATISDKDKDDLDMFGLKAQHEIEKLLINKNSEDSNVEEE